MQIFRLVARWALTVQIDVFTLLFAVILRVSSAQAWGARNGVVWVHLRAGSWFSSSWGKLASAITLGHVIVFDHDASPLDAERARLWRHELEHVRQIEARGIEAAIVALLVLAVGPWWMAAIVWVLIPVLGYFVGYLQAGLEHGGSPWPDWYRNSPDERAARAVSVAPPD